MTTTDGFKAGCTSRLSGKKTFIDWRERDMAANIGHLVLVRLPNAPVGVKGISLFLRPKFLVNANGMFTNQTSQDSKSAPSLVGLSPVSVVTDHEGPQEYGYAFIFIGAPP